MALAEQLKFDDKGLIPAIAVDYQTQEVLMMAYMNQEALEATLASGYATYWSRSREKLWRKGETSGHLQKVHWIRTDCDKDVLLLGIEQMGVACHTGRRSCFYWEWRHGQWEEIYAPEINPEDVYGKP